MNPNAPEHRPENASEKSIVKAMAEKIFSESDPEAAQLLNKSKSMILLLMAPS